MNETETPAQKVVRTAVGPPSGDFDVLRLIRDETAAKARLRQLHDGVVPKWGRGSCGGTTPLPEGKSWRPHVGRSQRVRGLKQVWARFEKLCLSDEWTRSSRERLLDFAADAPDSELAAMTFANVALLAAQATGETWADALNHGLNELEKARDATAEQKAPEGKKT